jgi:hypothetical protein
MFAEETRRPRSKPREINAWACPFLASVETIVLSTEMMQKKTCTGNGKIGYRGISWGIGPPYTAISLYLNRYTWSWGIARFPCYTPFFSKNGLVSTVFSGMTLFFRRYLTPPLPRVQSTRLQYHIILSPVLG